MMNLMSGARLLGEEIAFATNEMLDRAQIRRIPFENGGSAFGQ